MKKLHKNNPYFPLLHCLKIKIITLMQNKIILGSFIAFFAYTRKEKMHNEFSLKLTFIYNTNIYIIINEVCKIIY